MVLLEALALGVPVIAADCPPGGVRSALGDCEAEATGSGALLPVPLPGELASQEAWLPWLLTAMTDDARWAQWRQAALDRSRRFTAERAAIEWRATIEDVMR
jgi:glycosyltransferase involved in cell wall biosynthesis